MLTGTYIPVPYRYCIGNNNEQRFESDFSSPNMYRYISTYVYLFTGTVLYNNNEQRSESAFSSPNTYRYWKNLCLPVHIYRYRTVLYNNNKERFESNFSSPKT
jgi:hypothetical protein